MLSIPDVFRLVYAAGVAHTTVKRVYGGGRPVTRRTFDKLTVAATALGLPVPPHSALKKPKTMAELLERHRARNIAASKQDA
jgi:DNA-binding LacI/PurR family transcriptional regulator